MKRIGVIGGKDDPGMAEYIAKIGAKLNEPFEIVFYENEGGLVSDCIFDLDPIVFNSIPRFEIDIKAKHQPKGHERPYKYHR